MYQQLRTLIYSCQMSDKTIAVMLYLGLVQRISNVYSPMPSCIRQLDWFRLGTGEGRRCGAVTPWLAFPGT